METLPGGYWDGRTCLKSYSFRSLTGQMELDIIEAMAGAKSTPASVPAQVTSVPVLVTSVLVAALETFEGRKPTREIVHNFSVADRQFLMRKLAIMLGYDSYWFSKKCSNCEVDFDFQLTNSDLPVTPAQKSFPFVTLETSHGAKTFRVPTGVDQEAIASIKSSTHRRIDMQGAEDLLIGLCLCSNEDLEFTAEDMEKIEAALDEVSPGIITNINAGCPECGTEHQIRLDPYYLLQKGLGKDLFNEIHTIALNYNWSEAEILALSRSRREIYLGLIDQDGFAEE